MSAETSTRRGPLCVGLSTPDWPRGASPNGIVTHTVELEAALRELGVRPVILTWHVAPSTDQQPQTASDSGDILDISQFQPRSTLWSRVANKASRLFGADILLNTRLTMMARAARVAVERFPLDLIEIEEALGLALPVIKLGRVPVVVRLHGPWFLNGRALGVKEDAAFARRDRLEREVIARADAVTCTIARYAGANACALWTGARARGGDSAPHRLPAARPGLESGRLRSKPHRVRRPL